MHPGEIILQKYRLERQIGAGGMSLVFEAMQLPIDKRVAIKVLSDEAAKRPDASERFLREARAAGGLTNRNVVRILDYGMHDDAPCMVMELLEGSDFKSLGKISVEQATDYVLQAAVGLAEAHARGIVHRDLKPGNLFLSRGADGTEEVKVLDFGISKVQPSSESYVELTKTANVLGSPRYMSPEQVEDSSKVDLRTDIWSLGVVLYQLVAGKRPFIGSNDLEVLAQILKQPPTRLKHFEPQVPDAFEKVVLWCLEKDRERRPQSVLELARELAPFGPPGSSKYVTSIQRILGQSLPSNPSRDKTQDVITVEPETQPTDHTTVIGVRPTAKPSRFFAVAGVGVGVLSAATLLSFAWPKHDAPAPETLEPTAQPPLPEPTQSAAQELVTTPSALPAISAPSTLLSASPPEAPPVRSTQPPKVPPPPPPPREPQKFFQPVGSSTPRGTVSAVPSQRR